MTLSVMTGHLLYTTSPFYPLSPLFSHACSSSNHLPFPSFDSFPKRAMASLAQPPRTLQLHLMPCAAALLVVALPWSAGWFREPLQQVHCLHLTPGQWGWRLSQDSLGTGWDRSVHSSYWAIGVPSLAAVPLCSSVFVRISCLSRKPILNQII